MDAYSGFAKVYDLFMDSVPYEAWSRYLIRMLEEHGIFDGLVLDLACGTGKMTRLLADAGYDMIGIDASPEMLMAAMEQEEEASGVLYLQQDMRGFELYGTVRAVVSICDSMNYITEEEELLAVFSLVNNYLDPGGIFIFDLNTISKYEALGGACICENRKEASFIWENDYDEDRQLNEYSLTFFVREEDGRYQKFQETHLQRGYAVEAVRSLLEQAGMEFVACYGDNSFLPPKDDADRIWLVARECMKKREGERGKQHGFYDKGNGG